MGDALGTCVWLILGGYKKAAVHAPITFTDNNSRMLQAFSYVNSLKRNILINFPGSCYFFCFNCLAWLPRGSK